MVFEQVSRGVDTDCSLDPGIDSIRVSPWVGQGAFCLGLAEQKQPVLEARPPLLASGADLGLALPR